MQKLPPLQKRPQINCSPQLTRSRIKSDNSPFGPGCTGLDPSLPIGCSRVLQRQTHPLHAAWASPWVPCIQAGGPLDCCDVRLPTAVALYCGVFCPHAAWPVRHCVVTMDGRITPRLSGKFECWLITGCQPVVLLENSQNDQEGAASLCWFGAGRIWVCGTNCMYEPACLLIEKGKQSADNGTS